MTGYRRRAIDDELDLLMPELPAISIEGPRAVGKTATASERARTTFRLDDPGALEAILAGPDRLATSPPPVLIDEWQRWPPSWDIVRRAVDADRTGGRFLLTGSASPLNPATHPGAGRIVSIRMRPMSLAERGVERPSVSMAELLTGDRPPIDGETAIGVEAYAQEIVASGLPALRGLSERAVRAELDGYIERVIDRDFPDLASVTIRNPAGLRRWLTAYASAISGTVAYEKIRDAAAGGSAEKQTRVTVMHWLDALARLWIADPVPPWSPQRNDLSRLMHAPRHQMMDPAIAARLRGATVGSMLDGEAAGPIGPRDATVLGALFESLVTLCVRVHAQAAEGRVFHFRTRNGDHEVDLIVERGSDRRVVAIEAKAAAVISDADVTHLRWLRDRIGDTLLDAVVISTGRHAYRRADGIAVVPLALLGS